MAKSKLRPLDGDPGQMTNGLRVAALRMMEKGVGVGTGQDGEGTSERKRDSL